MLRKRFLLNVLFVGILMAMSPINANAVTISLVPDSLSVGSGQQFNLNVVLNNPTNQGLVGIGIWIQLFLLFMARAQAVIRIPM